MKPIPWFERKFELITEKDRLPGIIERLEGTALRLEEKILYCPEELICQNKGSGWSIQEHIGHLLNLEGLWYTRLSEILQGEKELTAADLTNFSTFESNYNDQDLEDILETFEEVRSQLIQVLRTVKKTDLDKAAFHPRLKMPMKIADLAFFIAEHDDHHIAMIHWLKREV